MQREVPIPATLVQRSTLMGHQTPPFHHQPKTSQSESLGLEEPVVSLQRTRIPSPIKIRRRPVSRILIEPRLPSLWVRKSLSDPSQGKRAKKRTGSRGSWSRSLERARVDDTMCKILSQTKSKGHQGKHTGHLPRLWCRSLLSEQHCQNMR